MKTFKQLFEWPYTEYKDKIFDLEVETFTKFSDFVTFLKYLTSGTDVKDKYGNVFKINTTSGMKKFKVALLNDKSFIESTVEHFNISLSEIKKLINSL